jgi:hypothetical protein
VLIQHTKKASRADAMKKYDLPYGRLGFATAEI